MGEKLVKAPLSTVEDLDREVFQFFTDTKVVITRWL